MASRLVELARASPMTSLVQTLVQYGGRGEESCDAQHTPDDDEQGVTHSEIIVRDDMGEVFRLKLTTH